MERNFRIFSLVSFLFSLATAAALAASPAEWDVADTPRTRESVEWIQGDTVVRAYRFSDEGEPLDLAAFDSVVWSVVSITNMAEQWAGTTGTVSTAETAVVSFRLTQEESALPVGNYWGFVRGLAGPPATPRQTTLVQQGIRVRPGPDPDAIDVVRPTLLSAQVASNTAAIAELQASAGNYVVRTNGEWVIVQDTAWNGIEWNGTRIFGADLKIQTNPGGRILSIDGIADGTISLSVWAAEDGGTLEASADLETWEACESAAWTADESSPNLWHVTAPTDGDVQFFRVATAGGVPDIREAVVRAYAPLYLNGGTGCRDLAATAGDVEDLRRDMHGELDGYAPLTGYEHDESLVPGERRVAWDLSPTGSTFNAVNLGGDLRTNWPGFKTGGPLFPFFVQATGVVARSETYWIPTGPEEDLGGIRAVPLAREMAYWLDTSAAGFTNVRTTVEGLAPAFAGTETLRWGRCEFPYGTLAGTGFWWQVSGPATGEWAVAIGSYTGRTTVTKTSTASTNRAWGWRSETPGTLREAISRDLEAAWQVPGKETTAWVGTASGGDGTWNADWWAHGMDISCVSPWWTLTNPAATGLASRDAPHTAVTRRHVVCAAHWHCRPGDGVLDFYDAEGNHCQRGVSESFTFHNTWVNEDCCLLMLDEDLPESIVPARVVSSNDFAKLAIAETNGWPIVSPAGVRGHRIEAAEVNCWKAPSVWFDVSAAAKAAAADPYDEGTGKKWLATNAVAYNDEHLHSGSPTLLWIGGGTILVSTMHKSDRSGPNILGTAPLIEAKIREWGGTTETNLYWADFSAWPEPNTTETTP